MLQRTCLAAALLCACQDAPSTTTNDLGLKLTSLSDNYVAGEMVTASGAVAFTVE